MPAEAVRKKVQELYGRLMPGNVCHARLTHGRDLGTVMTGLSNGPVLSACLPRMCYCQGSKTRRLVQDEAPGRYYACLMAFLVQWHRLTV